MPRWLPVLARGAVALAATLSLAACGGGDGADGAAAGGDAAVQVTGTDALAFEPSRLTAPVGEVTVELTSEPGTNHTFTIEELGDQEVVEAAAGETASGTVQLAAGSYTFYCSVPGHRDAGMEGTLTVE